MFRTAHASNGQASLQSELKSFLNLANGFVIKQEKPDFTSVHNCRLRKLLEDYKENCDLAEVEAIVVNNELHDNIRHAAYLHLIAHATLDVLQKLSAYMDFNYLDWEGNSAINVAIRMGRTDVLKWLTDTNRISLKPVDQVKSVDKSKYTEKMIHPVLTAAQYGQLAILRELTNPDGLNLSVYVTDDLGEGVVHKAAEGGQLEMLEELVKPVWQNGYGLDIGAKNSYGMSVLSRAVALGRLSLVKKMLTPESEGGYGLSVSDDVHKILYQTYRFYPETAICVKIHAINEALRTKNLGKVLELQDSAMYWAKYDNENNKGDKFLQALIKNYQELFVSFSKTPDFQRVISAFIILAEKGYADSFQCFLHVYKDKNCWRSIQNAVGVVLAQMIFDGLVRINNGELDVQGSNARNPLTRNGRMEINVDSREINVMHESAIFAYEYLHNNSHPEALALLKRFNIALAKDSLFDLAGHYWTKEVTKKYSDYYSKKNKALLTEPLFICSRDALTSEINEIVMPRKTRY